MRRIEHRRHDADDDCPLCERLAEDRAEQDWDNPAEQEWADRHAERSYEKHLRGE